MKLHLKHPIFNILSAYNDIDEFYACGGYVRNQIIKGDGGKDIDIFINCTPQQLEDLILYLNKYGHTDYGQYGSPRFHPSLDDEHYVDLVPFYNFVVSQTPVQTINDLLTNFDFTANAIGFNLKAGDLYDPVGGIKDIQNKILRAVRLDFPERTVSEEINISAVSVFWFRLLHYKNKLGFTMDDDTEKWIFENAYRMEDLEMFKRYFFVPQIDYDTFKRITGCLQQKKSWQTN